MSATAQAIEYCWAPQKGPQKALIDCPVYEIFYGGARGGGKTDGVLGKMALKALRYQRNFNGVMFRHELPMLDDAIARSHQIYTPIGGVWREQKKQWNFPSGGRLRFRPLADVQDAEKYQGQNLSDVCIEEAGNYPYYAPIARLHGALRSGGGVPPQIHLTGNPGGPGQSWIKERYVDPHPGGMRIITEQFDVRGTTYKRNRVYIPARVWDNRALLANDPNYIANLHLVGSDALVRAWLDGDWSAVEGAFFDCWKSSVIVEPFPIPESWYKFIAFDWGSASPFCCQWWAVASDDMITRGRRIPRGAMVCYQEWYGASAPNTGLKLTAEEVSKGILQRGDIKVGYADPAIFSQDGGPSIAERMSPLIWRPADNRRVGKNGALGGWDQMRARIKDDMLFFFATCVDSIRTIPSLQHDPHRMEDVNTDSEDHCADTTRYACMSRPYTPKPKQPSVRQLGDYKFNRDKGEGGQSWKTA